VTSAPVTQPALRFDAVDKTFKDGTVALAGAQFAVAPGEFVSVVGPSGCGKSTLLRVASGLDTATGGTVHVRSTGLAYVFQDPTLLPWRSVRHNVELLGELHGIAKPERRRRATEAIELVGLSGFEKHLPHELSGGMRMRTSLARSLTLEPDVFLFDEPFGALDEITRERLNDELLQLFTARGFAEVRHELGYRHADRRCRRLGGGRTEAEGARTTTRQRAAPDPSADRCVRAVHRGLVRGLLSGPRPEPAIPAAGTR
jgi:NitT/TauT family transport system ATP-binding protein